jgi:hypothetical protein
MTQIAMSQFRLHKCFLVLNLQKGAKLSALNAPLTAEPGTNPNRYARYMDMKEKAYGWSEEACS